MKQKLWRGAFVLVFLRAQLVFFYVRTAGDGTLETREILYARISTYINHLATPQSPLCGSLEFFPCDHVEEPDSHYSNAGERNLKM